MIISKYWAFAENIDQDQTSQNEQSDLGSTLTDKEIFFWSKT